ncbi:hypothetical protein [Actimicrobium sp. CCI2.3]|uniref:hypothetical protein n=1 Tax=Actimicrobium sp. CCI2.3 TaxID=3048616 RepID=UPI002AB50747|nr:hypothetical protein [Actimicrobium sp. CCI2.3]MDY7574457.1 hypothetical protein [Actimicrobium sp. CCI2.3]MEB0022465.1 hypothetical protein [Actimicrobium sp. CCI2.3]
MTSYLLVLLPPAITSAQTTLVQPTPWGTSTRTVFKCTVDKAIVYSDVPCLGAQRLQIEPSRGLNKTTGKELVGTDVGREKKREVFAEAIRPLTGLNSQQLETETRRSRLAPSAKSDCRQLDGEIARTERSESSSNQESRLAIQEFLYDKRNRYHQLGC